MRKDLFRERISESIADTALQSALDGNAERRNQGRLSAFDSLPDHQERRQKAHDIRKKVITDLDKYLSIFIQKVEENGIQVHRANNGEEAVQIFMEIALSHDAHLIAKSKSMVSEEVNLNHELESVGFIPVETDLGEYIVQLRGERPSHIITPAVHLRRHEVGKLFEDKLGISYTEDISTLTNTARKILRDVFLDADIGLSGVNFGVAESGTVCIVTNEGNGRMVTTIPPLHIALMGIERLVPDMNSLALMLSLLPRSATSQKLSVYTNLIQKPRGEKESEGPRERHLILLDNGRSLLRNSNLQDVLMCIRCGACLNACPVFREIGGHGYIGKDGSIAPYPGPIGSVVSPGLFGLEKYGNLCQASSLCGACKEVCPVDIDLPNLLLKVRSGEAPATRGSLTTMEGVGVPRYLKLGLKAFRFAALRPSFFSFSQWVIARLSRLISRKPKWIHLPSWTGWGSSKDFPHPSAITFHNRWDNIMHESPMENNAIKQEMKSIDETEKPKPALIVQFIEELESLNGECIRCEQKELSDVLNTIIEDRSIKRVLLDEKADSLLDNKELERVKLPDAECRIGISCAKFGLADTGSLIVTGGAGENLCASLLPETHISILNFKDLYATLADVINSPIIKDSSSTVVISGPSRTADIEMTLTIGVHGPKELIVLLVDG